MKTHSKWRPWLHAAVLPLLAAASLGCLYAPVAAGQSPHDVAPERAAAPQDQRPRLDSRARRLARMLELSEAQQIELAKVLAEQRKQIRRLWGDQQVAPEYRVTAMRAINDQTEERIRALLNDEQKKKYVSSRPREPSKTPQQTNRDYWLDAAKSK